MKGLMAVAALSAVLAALTACVGGGEPGMPVVVVPPGTMAEDDERREALAGEYRAHPAFARQWGLERIGADQAYARLAMKHGEDVVPGAGVTVGVFDSGIDVAHPAFAHTRVDEVFFPEAGDETGVLPSHGTAVASVIAGGRESSLPDGAQGVAPGADLVVFALGGGEPDPPPDPDLPTEYFPEWSDLIDEFDEGNAAELRTVLDWRDGERRVDFLNLSVGGFGMIDGYTERELRTVFDRTIATIAQAGVEEKTVFVWAAGNENGLPCLPNQPYCLGGMVAAGSPGYEAGLAARIAEVRGHTVAVVSVTEKGEIADYSNRCGLAADWCIAAPGDDISLAWFGPDEETGAPGARGTWTAGGTSFAAPMVTGGLAVMKHLFRGQLSNSALLARLLETADRNGRYGEAKVYGRGLIDLEAATSPVGGERVAMGPRIGGLSRTLRGTRLQLGGAAGDSLHRSFASREIVAFDSLGAPFWHPLGSRVTQRTPSAAHSRLRSLLSEKPLGGETSTGRRIVALDRTVHGEPDPARWELGFFNGAQTGMDTGHLGLSGEALVLRYTGGGGIVVEAFSSEGMEGALPVVGGGLSWRGGPVGVRGGWLSERDSALGTRAEGAFGSLAADALFIRVDAGLSMGFWRVSGGAEAGLARPDPQGGLIGDISAVATSAVALHAERAIGAGGTIRLSVSQPLRVEAGRVSLILPVGRTGEGEVVRESVASGLTPSGRQVDVSARWRRQLDHGGELAMGAYVSFDPGHRRGAAPAVDLLAGYRLAF